MTWHSMSKDHKSSDDVKRDIKKLLDDHPKVLKDANNLINKAFPPRKKGDKNDRKP